MKMTFKAHQKTVTDRAKKSYLNVSYNKTESWRKGDNQHFINAKLDYLK